MTTTSTARSYALGSSPRAVRVASVPSGHVYVEHLADADLGIAGPGGTDGVDRLPDPPPAVPGRWWPPAMLGDGWIDAHRHEFDVFHLQFGFDALRPAELGGIVSALRRAGKPLVYTVHDLRNPHHQRRAEHDAQLDVLIPHADALITLTAGAAAEIEARWGRRPVVVPHPHVVGFARMAQPRPVHDGFVVGVHAKSLRACAAPLPVIRALAPLMPQLPGARLQVNVHRESFDPGGPRHDPELVAYLRRACADGEIDLRVHDYLSDDALWDYLQGLDVSVLPYRFGTHSGWLEACHDLGTTVVAPTCGYYAQQQPCLSYHHDETGLDDASLTEAVRTAYDPNRPPRSADPARRRQERAAIAAAHRKIYAEVAA